LLWEVLVEMGHFPSSAPATLRQAMDGGRLDPEGLVDQYNVRNPEVRQLLIDYLAHRTAAGMDYGSVRHPATNLVRNFWLAIEDINPDQPDLNLDEDTYQAWVAKPSHLSRAMPSVPRVRPLRLASTSPWRRVRIRSASRSSVVESVR
jgi:hypothetical protein